MDVRTQAICDEIMLLLNKKIEGLSLQQYNALLDALDDEIHSRLEALYEELENAEEES